MNTSKHEPMHYGHKYSWLVRLINFGMSWVAPVDIERMDTEATDTKVAVVQVQGLDVHDPQAKVVVAGSRYEDCLFLGIFEGLNYTFRLVRIHCNRVLLSCTKSHRRNQPVVVERLVSMDNPSG